MPLFICDKCGVLENTALGHYWSRNMNLFGDELKEQALCSECSPNKYFDGSPNEDGGKWHGKFPREFPDAEKVLIIGADNFVGSRALASILAAKHPEILIVDSEEAEKMNDKLRSFAPEVLMAAATLAESFKRPIFRYDSPIPKADEKTVNKIIAASQQKQKQKEARRAMRFK